MSQAVRPEVDIFSQPPTDITDERKSCYTAFYPTVSLKEEQAPVEFVIGGNSDSFVDLKSSFLYLRIKVFDKDNKELKSTGDVSLANFPIASLFEKSEFYINGHLVSTINQYGYVGYLAAHLSNDSSAKKTSLFSGLYVKDTKGEIVSTNSGLVERAGYVNGSKAIELIGNIYDPFWLQKRYIPPNISMKLRLFRNKTEFVILHKVENNPAYKLVIEEATLHLSRHFLAPQIYNPYINKLNAGEKAIYPLTQHEVLSFPIAQGSTSHVRQWLFPNNKLPRRLVVAFVSTKAFEGTYGENPFNFQHFGLSKITLSLNDDPGMTETREFNFDDKRFLIHIHFQSLLTLFEKVSRL